MGAEFSGKRILVTGSTRGIGRATAELIHERGGEVIWHGRSRMRRVSAAAAAGGTLAVGGDLADRADCRRIAAEVGEVDVLINCAGIFEEAPIAETSEALWDSTHRRQPDRRLDAVARPAARPAPPPRRDRQRRLRRRPARLSRLRRLLRLEGRAHRADAGARGGAGAGRARRGGLPGAGRDRHDARSRRRRARSGGRPAELVRGDDAAPRRDHANEIAEAIAFAASPRASYMTGDLLVIAGGATAGRRVGG